MTKERMVRVLRAIMATEPDELTCDNLIPEQRSLYVESELAGEDPSARYPRIAHHLRHCHDCAEEMADLRLMLEMAREELPQPAEVPTFDLSFLQSEQIPSALEAAQDIVHRFFAEEVASFEAISEQFFAQVEKLRAQRSARAPRRIGWLEKLFPRLPATSYGMGLSELKPPEGGEISMTLRVLVAATRIEEELSSHRADLVEGGALPESVRRRLLEIGQEAELPDKVTEALVKRLQGIEVDG